MGAYWLLSLPDVCEAAGLDVDVWPGWETRSRSSGGYDEVWAIFCHHTASNTTLDSDCNWMWSNPSNENGPVGAIYLDRSGLVVVGAAGATNCQGKGGPCATSHGTIPTDKGNCFGIAIEAGNAGTGEPWPIAQQQAYVTLVAALCDAYNLDPLRDTCAHFEWAPSRKIDPAGESAYANGAEMWDMDLFRHDIAACQHGDIEPPPEPEPEEPDMLTDEDVDRIADAVWGRAFNAAGVPAADNPKGAGWLLAQGYGRAVEARDWAKRAAENTETS